MRYVGFACDFDGTIASDGIVSDEVLQALSRLKNSGRSLVLVTGRKLDDLLRVFEHSSLFDYLVCENGGVLYHPETRAMDILAEPPARSFIERLQARGVTWLDVGQVIIASWVPNETIILEVIQELCLDLHISFNKGAVMILPPDVNKGTGLTAALNKLGLSSHNVVVIGDGENDHAMFSICECSVAVGDALVSVKEHADLIMRGENGHGVVELINKLIENDLCETDTSNRISLGVQQDGTRSQFRSYDCRVLIAGPSKSGKSTVAISILNDFAEAGYQYCVIDPEGEYDHAPHAVTVGNQHYSPSASEIVSVLENPQDSVVVNLLSVPLDERPSFLSTIVSSLKSLRNRKGRPHWIVVDEAHHMLHPFWDQTLEPGWSEPGSVIIITVDPSEISTKVLSAVDIVVAVGDEPSRTLSRFAKAIGHQPPVTKPVSLGWGEILVWFRHEYGPPVKLTTRTLPVEHQRHIRKYAAGDIGVQRSFYFTGPENRLRIKCQNLFLFLQIADGLDAETWLFHLKRGDYSTWFRDVIHDHGLEIEAQAIEKNGKFVSG
ncbi:MAG: HAD-IIB family hydrolase [Candidatus Melainabacteria bacterium]|nr:HAD-IIB family hydrolase [Candidatus Melainabacteria bacterium]